MGGAVTGGGIIRCHLPAGPYDYMLMLYIRTDTQIPKQYRSMYDGGSTWENVRKKYD